MPTIVDIHCHNFNGDDLPVKGFINRVGGTKTSLVSLIDRIVDAKVQGHAPGFAEEMAQINQRLDPILETPEAAEPDLDATAQALFDEIAADDPEQVKAAEEEIRAESAGDTAETSRKGDVEAEPVPEGVIDFGRDVKRWIKWALLFTKHRVRLTEILATTYSEVDLFTPMLVDLVPGLSDPTETTVTQQLEMQAAISRVSMLGRLRGAENTRVHPFVGYDPRRVGANALVRAAVEAHGCIGVKLYPPMGFRPLGNTHAPLPKGLTQPEAEAVDEALRAFYEYCEANDVPVTAHSNPTNFAAEEYREFSSPSNWRAVLDEFPRLRLNLGHFGGSGEGEFADWPRQIAAMAADFEHLYADVGNHRLGDMEFYMDMLQQLFAEPETRIMQSRLMFGTDWFMVANHRSFEDFLTEFRDAFSAAFPDATFPGATKGFMGGIALRFLGFDDPSNRNNLRTAARYEAEGLAPPRWLTAA